MHQMAVPASDDQFGFACHTGMDGVPSQKAAEYTVIGIGRQAADHVARVNVFDVYIDLFCLEMLADGVFQVDADILQA
jgi:hypothetical protein